MNRPKLLSRLLPVLGIVVVVAALLAAGVWYWGPGSAERRLDHADLLALDAATTRDPRDGLAWYYLGVRLHERGATAEAAGALNQAVELRPNDTRAKVALGGALLELGRIEPAFQLLKAADGADPRSVEAKALLGRLYQRRASYGKAVQEWEAILALQPNNADAWHHLAFCRLQMQQVDQATAAVDHALKLQPRDADVLRLAASIAASRGDLLTARKYFEAEVAANPDNPRGYHDLANYLLTQSRAPEDVKRAEWAVEQLARLQPNNVLLPWHHARLAAFRQDWPGAIRYLGETLAGTPALDEAYFELANAYNRVGNHIAAEQAMSTYRRRTGLRRKMDEIQIRLAIKEDPDLYFELARLRREAGNVQSAREAVESGLRLAPASARGQGELAQLKKLESAPGAAR
jgi:tetratricopeptide (TPR) repeat protein